MPGLADLPAPVARYLPWALDGSERIETVRMTQAGVLRTDPRSRRWMAFDAEHVVVPPSIRFEWSARISIAPLLRLRVRDALIDGRGSGEVRFSAFTVSSAGGTPEMNSGSLHRYLAEAVWYPTALLATDGLRWSAIDGSRALAMLTDRETTVSLEFRFADTGEVTGIYTPARRGRFDGGYRQVPWEGHFHDYEHRAGVFVPRHGEGRPA